MMRSEAMHSKMPELAGDLQRLVYVPVSVGELVDKITILEIKSERISDPQKLDHIRLELKLLRDAWDERGGPRLGLDKVINELKRTNESLWVIEDDIRDCERQKEFGQRFLDLARAVYQKNDRRFKLKRKINESAGSSLIEEKSYSGY